MFVTTQRASAWLDLQVGISSSVKGSAATGNRGPHTATVRTLFATRPFETPAGRCIAVRLNPAAARRASSPRLLVLFDGRYERGRGPR